MKRLLRAVFVSRDGRTRSGWVVLVFLTAMGLLFAGLTWLLTVAGLRMPLHERSIDDPRLALEDFGHLATALLATLIACWAGRQRLGDAFLRDPRWLSRAAVGGLFGAGIMTVAALVPWLFGYQDFAAPSAALDAVLLSGAAQLLVLLPAGVFEEVLFRGVLLQQLTRGLGRILGVLLTAALFSLVHRANPGAGPFALVNIALVGVLFGVLTLRTGSLWLTSGLHVSWNWFQGFVYGAQVSGLDAGLSLLERRTQGNPYWSGAGFGFEASWVVTALMVALTAAALLWPARRLAAEPAPAEPATPPGPA